jgi:aminoglycoside phosphotransferase (APT) family kinase protein
MREWSAEVAVDGALVRRLLGDQFPELALRSVVPVDEGWDNAVWLVDDAWAFRFPRREIAIPGVERELAILPWLAPHLPLPVPVPVFRGRPAHRYPWPFFGAAFLPGRELAAAALTDAARNRLAAPLGSFLRTLHGPEIAATVAGVHELAEDPLGRADMARRVPRTVERLQEVERLGLWRPPASVARLLDEALGLPAPGPAVVVHGDLHFRHVLVDGEGAPTGVIDWGDLCRADPCVDLQLAWSLLPPDGRARFLDAYGPVDEGRRLRARVLALFLGAALAVYAHSEGMLHVEREAIEALERAALD